MPDLINSSYKVLLIWDRMGDYHRARWKTLQSVMGENNVLAADLASGDLTYQWEQTNASIHFYKLSDKSTNTSDFFRRIYNFIRLIRIGKINVIVQAGYGRSEYIFFILFSKLTGRKLILFAESWYPGNWFYDRLKGLLLRMLVDGFFVSGSRAEIHFHKRLGIPLRKIRKGYSVVENEHFTRSLISARSINNDQTELSKFNLPTQWQPVDPLKIRPYILCVARYSPEKNLQFLINAFRKSGIHKKWKLVLIGDGPEYTELEKLIKNDDYNILITGWKSYDSLPLWYAGATFFVLPSIFEPWGLVVNEAMAVPLPVIVSGACGCVSDLVKDGVNGYVFDPRNQAQLIDIFNQISILDDSKTIKMGVESYKIISSYTLKNWANELHSLISSE